MRKILTVLMCSFVVAIASNLGCIRSSQVSDPDNLDARRKSDLAAIISKNPDLDPSTVAYLRRQSEMWIMDREVVVLKSRQASALIKILAQSFDPEEGKPIGDFVMYSWRLLDDTGMPESPNWSRPVVAEEGMSAIKFSVFQIGWSIAVHGSGYLYPTYMRTPEDLEVCPTRTAKIPEFPVNLADYDFAWYPALFAQPEPAFSNIEMDPQLIAQKVNSPDPPADD